MLLEKISLDFLQISRMQEQRQRPIQTKLLDQAVDHFSKRKITSIDFCMANVRRDGNRQFDRKVLQFSQCLISVLVQHFNLIPNGLQRLLDTSLLFQQL